MPKVGPSKPLRLLAPAPVPTPDFVPASAPTTGSSSGRPAGENVSPQSVIPPRRMLVKNACSNCKAKKTKCDGKRPTCTRCNTRQLECVFETLYGGMTKQESAEFEITRLQGIIADLDAKFRVLKHGSQDEAQSMLASIRQQVQNDEHDEWSRLPDPLNAAVLPTSSSSELSDAFEEHEFLPLLFNRREWTRGPSSNDDDTSLGIFAAPETANLEQSVDHLPAGLDHDLTPRHSNNFKNLPFSSAILANHFPHDIQQQQHANVFQPLWSILPLATLPGAQSVKDSVATTIQQARLLIQSGQSLDQVAGKSCNIGAILDHDQYNRTTLLSQWAARIVFSVQRRSPEFVAFASMHLAWLLARWMIDPRQETFLALPEWFRPTISQLYIPHVDLVDFLLWPSLRDMITNRPDTLQKDWRWLDDMSRTIECDWFINVDLALETNTETGEIHLTEIAKACAETIENWSVGSSVCQYIDACSTVKVRPNHQ